MKVKNNCARLIDINFEDEKYRLMPAGESVDMPDEALEKSDFLNALIDDGSVKVTKKPKTSKSSEKDKPEADKKEAKAKT